MAQPRISVFADLEALSRQAVAHFTELAENRTRARDIFTVALSGGSTPRRLYELLATPPWSEGLPWSSIQFFQVDERCVPPDHVESNYRMIREALLDRAGIPEENFHRIEAERSDREEAALEYAKQIARFLRPRPGAWPRFDLVLLGMGADGHTASLFPGSPALDEKHLWVASNYVKQLAACRVTLTLPVLNAAAEILFLVAGAEKAERLREVIADSDGPRRLPAQRVAPSDGTVIWYLDEAAAGWLQSPG